MSTYLYDNALIDKIKGWTSSSDITIYAPDDTKRLFEVISDTNNDRSVKLPLIAISRKKGYQITNTNSRPLSYDGLTLDASIEKSIQLNAIPIQLSYQLDIYTRYFKEADEYARNLIFNFINFPVLSVIIPYNDSKILHKSVVEIATDVDDNSDIPERFVHGEFTRLTLNLNVPDAYLWDVRLRDNCYIDGIIYKIE